jgi:CubicO group peptidase (beta-lactamase class C family)
VVHFVPEIVKTGFNAAVILLGLAFPALLAAQVRVNPIDAIFSPLKSDSAPGAAVEVIHRGHVIFQRGYGVAELRTRERITPQTNFRLASCTKQFTAMAIMLLVHDGKLRYDQTLSEVFPGFPAHGKTITIRHLLNHTSGLKDYEDLLAAQYPKTPDEKIPQIHDADVLTLMERQTATDFPPGSQWRYSNSGYVLLGLVVQKASGEPFGRFLEERIFASLEMKNTVLYEKGKNDVAQRAYGHTLTRGRWKQTDQSSTSATLGDGGIYSSVDDLAKWDAALGSYKLLSEKEMREALTPVRVPAAKDASAPLGNQSYGFGWFLDPYKGHKHMWHYGETVGFRTAIERFPDDELTVLVLANRSDVNPQELALKAADLYLAGTSARQP